MACFSFIAGCYNPVRLHSALGHRSPIAYDSAMEIVSTETRSPKSPARHEIGVTSRHDQPSAGEAT